jgi:drug/metabolite transporter (DMT)-like permease
MARAGTAIAGALALLAALLWSSYYFFVLNLQARGVGAGPIIELPFLAGGLGYLALALATGRGREIGAIAREPTGLGRVGLLLGMQLAVLGSTYALGAVDTSLLTLVGDVVATPLLVFGLFGEGHDRLRSWLFVLGVTISTAGAALAIIAGGSTRAVTGSGWALAAVVPLAVAAYFIWTSRAGRTRSTAALVAHATLGASIVAFVVGPWLPGPDPAPWQLGPIVLILLVANGLISFFVAPWLYFRAIATAGILLPSVLMATIPVFTLLLGVVLLGAVPPFLGAIGIPLAVGGSLLAMRGESSLGGEEEPGGPAT